MAPHLQLYGIIPVLVTATALVLSFLCVFAGHTPGFMDNYAVMTLNTSRIGQNAVEKIDNKIMGFNVSNIIQKRSAPTAVIVARATVTPAPELDIAPRQLGDFVDGLTEGAASLKSEAGDAITSAADAIESKATAVASAVESKASSIEGVVASKIESAIGSMQTAAVRMVNETYDDFLVDMDLREFYSVHMMSTCEGRYVTEDGANITIGQSPVPGNGTEKVVDSCSKHSSLNIMSFVRVIYQAGIFFTALALLLAIWGTVRFSRHAAIINIIGSLPAFGLLAIASAATHILAIATSAVVNFLGNGVGVEISYGGNFIAMAWAATILVLVNLILWTILLFVGEKLRAPVRNKSAGKLPEHEMKTFR